MCPKQLVSPENLFYLYLSVFEEAFLIVILNTPFFIISMLNHIVRWVCHLNNFNTKLSESVYLYSS